MAIVLAVLVRPWLWWTAIKLAVRMKPDDGWAPSTEYLLFRKEVFGGTPTPAEFIGYLRWCRAFPGPVH